uniref:Uncharacterized protein n=1 Tax=Emiliania huxleyi TaxID=2903 RepID=A0A6V2W8P1_EMIHU|mmetsp:Transcript_20311/g.59514  ORF Transcript_20311/g.59514 Transcript_20311/m.59514 type:complete len:222 (+) Transcript_20311:606-1271(+)
MYLSDLESLGGHRPQISRVETVGGRRYVQFYQPYAATYFLSASQLKESIAQAEAAARAKHRSGQAVPWWLENQQTSNRRDDGSLLFVREENAGLWLRGQRRAVLPVDRLELHLVHHNGAQQCLHFSNFRLRPSSILTRPGALASSPISAATRRGNLTVMPSIELVRAACACYKGEPLRILQQSTQTGLPFWNDTRRAASLACTEFVAPWRCRTDLGCSHPG